MCEKKNPYSTIYKMSGFAVSLPFEWSKPHAMNFSGFFLKAKYPIIISQQPENCENVMTILYLISNNRNNLIFLLSLYNKENEMKKVDI